MTKGGFLALGSLIVLGYVLTRPKDIGFSEVGELSVKPREDDISYSVKDFVQPDDTQLLFIDLIRATNEETILNCYRTVCEKITYKEDVTEYWKFPAETWESKAGDCEDSAFLLCSLLSNKQIEVFVAAGSFFSGGKEWGHAWVVLDYFSETYIFESTLDALPGTVWRTEQELSEYYRPYMYWNSERILVRPGYDIYLLLARMGGKKDAIDNLWRTL